MLTLDCLIGKKASAPPGRRVTPTPGRRIARSYLATGSPSGRRIAPAAGKRPPPGPAPGSRPPLAAGSFLKKTRKLTSTSTAVYAALKLMGDRATVCV